MNRHRRRVGAAGFIVSLMVGTLVAAVPAAPVASQSSENCGGGGEISDLEPGEYSIPIATQIRANGSAGVGQFALTVTYQGDVNLTVSKDGEVDAATADIEVSFDGTVTGVPGLGGVVGGGGSGGLTLASARGRDIQLTGDITGVGDMSFFGVADTSFTGSETDTEHLTLKVGSVSCDGADGTWFSSTLTQSLNGMYQSGLTVEQEPMMWRAEAEVSPKIQEILDELTAIEQLGTAGPDRRSATSRLYKSGVRIRDLPDAEQSCVFKRWLSTARTVLQKRINSDLAALAKLRPTSADMAPLYGVVGSLIESETQYALVGLDQCSEGDRRYVYEAIAGAIESFLKKAVDDGRVADIIKLSGHHALFGEVSPRLAKDADALVADQLFLWEKTARINLDRLAQGAKASGNTSCSASDLQAVRKAIAARKTSVFWGNEHPPLDDLIEMTETLGCA